LFRGTHRRTLRFVLSGAIALTVTAAALIGAPAPSRANVGLSVDRILHDARLYDALTEAGVRERVLHNALAALRRNADQVRNLRYLTLIDFGLHSSKPRLFLVDMKTASVEALLVAHGQGSDPDHDGFADKFSNVEGSKMSSLGAYVTRNTYRGKHGLSLRLEGLDRTNSRAYQRAIVMHGADYVDPGRKVLGRSWGCPAIERKYVKRLMPQLAGGSFIYIAK